MSKDFLEMNWKFSCDGKSIVEFNNKALDQEVTISKRQLFAFLTIINMSNPNISNSNYNIGSWLLGFDRGNFTDDFLQTTQ